MKEITRHFSLLRIGRFQPIHDWTGSGPQCGDALEYYASGVPKKTPAFFEAFPPIEINGKTHNVWIRGEGETVEAAEQQCWEWLQKVVAPHEHRMERRNRADGYAFCVICDIGAMCFEPLTACAVCNQPTRFSQSIDERWWCENHLVACPEQLRSESMKYHIHPVLAG